MAAQEALAHADGQLDAPPPRERPWLLPYNRKLRHLQGITIRNLTLTANPLRSRGKTFDDEAIPSTLKSPTKALALRESKGLSHSRSSSDLKSSPEATRQNGSLREPTTPTKPTRPGFGKGLKRRTTIEWTNASPLTRQKKLEDITAGRMADTFFTLHVEEQEDPIYVSEVAEKAMNPNFKFFDLSAYGPGVTRLDRLTVRLWAKTETMTEWQYLMDYTVRFRSLQFIGKTLGRFRHPLPQNCVLFHMTDGIYTSFTDLPVQERVRQEALAPPREHPEGRVLTSSSYDALMRLSTLDDCIQDAIATRDRIADEIEHILESNKEAISAVERVPETEEILKTVESAVIAEKRRVVAARRRRDELQASIEQRKEKMRLGREQQSMLSTELPSQRETHAETLILHTQQIEAITAQRRRICEDLQRIFPIDPSPNGKTLSFTIRSLPLPNSTFDDADQDVTAAALSYVAHIVTLLSPYLSVILPYPITLHGSTSTIHDPLALGTQTAKSSSSASLRVYPLYMRGVVRYRFDYAVFLLNKNIEILSNALGLRPLDIRHTLPNLKYLLYIATAGKGELPARKAGGIKGLLGIGGNGRKGSMDSFGSFGTVESGGTP
ncbi:hypothetical protein T440DRAFT_314068 [Plenodomus tracheiphilus IPT5]|uniref:Autophagy-related protein 14 n=1 Tax=Plenodomus tracheiphilus IPT5 TaxID=1408161 RepID=A0A6A7AQR0_9PLEO|nr:hypothetical protein T440DRAFT_314068 [Plenodomus tracheiphilus IPT5]